MADQDDVRTDPHGPGGPDQPQVSQPSDVPEFYGNQMQLAGTPFDVLVLMGLGEPAGPGQQVPFNPVVQLRMSLPMAKLLRLALAQLISNYEGQYGEIPLPPELTQSISAQTAAGQRAQDGGSQ